MDQQGNDQQLSQQITQQQQQRPPLPQVSMSGMEVRILKNQLSTHRRSLKDYVNTQVTLKVAILGPPLSGKTKIANQVGDIIREQASYEPTSGVRILEVPENIVARSMDGASTAALSLTVEVWDVGGDQKYEGCWPAITDKLNGAIVVFDPTVKSQAHDVKLWCEWFCKRANLQDNQIVIFAHCELTQAHKPLTVKLGDRSVVVPIVNVSTSLVSGPDGMLLPRDQLPARVQFRNFLGGVYAFHPHADFDSYAS